MIDPTGVLATTKTIFRLAKAAGNVQLQEQVIELVGSLNEAVAENTALLGSSLYSGGHPSN